MAESGNHVSGTGVKWAENPLDSTSFSLTISFSLTRLFSAKDSREPVFFYYMHSLNNVLIVAGTASAEEFEKWNDGWIDTIE